VGGVGFELAARRGAGTPPEPREQLQLRPDLDATSADAAAEADRFNDLSVSEFKGGRYRQSLGYAREAVRLAPESAVYAANCSAAALKAGKPIEAARHGVRATRLEPSYAKGHLRAAQANLEHGSRESVQLAIAQFERALALEPSSAAAKRGKKDALLTWEADFEDEPE
jgi:tetratricopeptide (TPR) repeat protein